jgi:aspartyl-tRNA(Asn)/glutamyl-tRNA(Gln) amidotransferase subunit C
MSKEDLKVWLERISKLSLIRISKEEEETILNDMKKIIEFFNTINSLDLSNVEPLFMVLKDEPVVRDDEVGESLSVDEVLKNVKEVEGGFIKGPKTA